MCQRKALCWNERELTQLGENSRLKKGGRIHGNIDGCAFSTHFHEFNAFSLCPLPPTLFSLPPSSSPREKLFDPLSTPQWKGGLDLLLFRRARNLSAAGTVVRPPSPISYSPTPLSSIHPPPTHTLSFNPTLQCGTFPKRAKESGGGGGLNRGWFAAHLLFCAIPNTRDSQDFSRFIKWWELLQGNSYSHFFCLEAGWTLPSSCLGNSISA